MTIKELHEALELAIKNGCGDLIVKTKIKNGLDEEFTLAQLETTTNIQIDPKVSAQPQYSLKGCFRIGN